jgi:hypothetical protein
MLVLLISKSKPHLTIGNILVQDTTVFVNLWSFHSDTDFWGDPEEFRPERFLNEKGELLKDYSLPFGAGQCSQLQSQLLDCDLLSSDTLYTKRHARVGITPASYSGDLRFRSWHKDWLS